MSPNFSHVLLLTVIIIGIFLYLHSFPQPNCFLIRFTTYGRTPWMSDQLVAKPVPTQDNKTDSKHKQTCHKRKSNPRTCVRALKVLAATGPVVVVVTIIIIIGADLNDRASCPLTLGSRVRIQLKTPMFVHIFVLYYPEHSKAFQKADPSPKNPAKCLNWFTLSEINSESQDENRKTRHGLTVNSWWWLNYAEERLSIYIYRPLWVQISFVCCHLSSPSLNFQHYTNVHKFIC
jgi:hypothetical protein